MSVLNPTVFGINVDQEFQSGLTGFGDPNFGVDDWTLYYPTSQVQADLKYLYSLGIRRLRIAAGDLTSPTAGFRDTRFAVHLQTVKLASAMGFHVEFGAPPNNTLSPSGWKFWIDNHLTYALQFQAVITQYGNEGVWYVGNENESNSNLASAGGRDIITSMTRVSNVVTVVMPATHSLTTGDKVRYYNAASANGSGSTLQVATNSTQTVTVVDAFTFTFASVGTDGTTSVGWIQYDQTTVRNQMKRMATYLKANGISVPISYSCVQGPDFNGQYNIHNFGLLGRGDIDYVDLNMYGQLTEQNANYADFVAEIADGVAQFTTDHFRVTEWHVSYLDSRLPTDPRETTYWLMRRQEYLESIPGLKHFVFCYRHPSNLLAMRRPYNTNVGSTLRDWWWPLVRSRQRTYEVVAGSPISVSEVRNSQLVKQIVWNGLSMNYGQDTQDGSYDTTTINADLTAMWNMGVRKLRIAFSTYTGTAGVASSKTLALAAKAMGFYVIWGVAHIINGTDDTTWAAYTAAVNTAADWAWSNNIDEFCLGNEIEYAETHGSLTSSVVKIKAMASDVKTNHFMSDGTTRFISYAMGQSAMEYTGAPNGWISTGRGDIDLLGYNVYGDNNLNVADGETQLEIRTTDLYNAFGSHLYISEWNIGSGTLFPDDLGQRATILKTRLNFFKNLGITTICFFTYRWDKAGTSDKLYWPAIIGTVYRSWMYALIQSIISVRATNPVRAAVPVRT